MPKKEEIEDTFETFHSTNLLNILSNFKNETFNKGIKILNNANNNMEKEFIDIIKYNIDIRDYYDKYLRNNSK